jgi:hypothetical protein
VLAEETVVDDCLMNLGKETLHESKPSSSGDQTYNLPVEVWRIIFQNLNDYLPIRCATVSKLFLHEIVFQSVTTIYDLSIIVESR